MKEKVKLRTKLFRICLSILFIIFITIFISNKYGYYEYKKHEQVTLTEEQIKQFESDVRDGKQVDIESYLSNVNPNYQTKFSEFGLNVSDSISKIIKKSVESLFSKINQLVEE